MEKGQINVFAGHWTLSSSEVSADVRTHLHIPPRLEPDYLQVAEVITELFWNHIYIFHTGQQNYLQAGEVMIKLLWNSFEIQL